MVPEFINNRGSHFYDFMEPVLNYGGIVMTERYKLATFAYQGLQGNGFDLIEELHEEASIPNPHLTYVLDIGFDEAMKRMEGKGEEIEKFERDPEFLKKLIDYYRDLTQRGIEDPNLFGPLALINSSLPEKDVARQIFSIFNQRFGYRLRK
jgi:thymidylate kinase